MKQRPSGVKLHGTGQIVYLCDLFYQQQDTGVFPLQSAAVERTYAVLDQRAILGPPQDRACVPAAFELATASTLAGGSRAALVAPSGVKESDEAGLLATESVASRELMGCVRARTGLFL